MRLNAPELQNILAGEYVLGTLRGPARRRFEAYLRESAALREAVQSWEQSLAPLLALPEQAPSRDLLPLIEKRLGWTAPDKAPSERRLGWLPALGFALVAVFSIMLWAPWETRLTPDFAVQIATEDGTLRWQFAVDKRRNWIDVRVVQSPDVESDRDLELWLLVENAAPISLGLLSEQDGDIQRIKAAVDLSGGQGLAVSVEPRGGSPSGAPTGPVIGAQTFPSA